MTNGGTADAAVDSWMVGRTGGLRRLGDGGAAGRPLIRPLATFSPAGEKGRIFWFGCYKDVAPTALGRAGAGLPVGH